MDKRAGLSVEGSLGMGAALLSSLIPVDSPVWRIGVLFIGGGLIADAIRKSEWVREKHPVLSLVDGFVANESESPWRTLIAVTCTIAAIIGYGMATWPHKIVPESASLVYVPTAQLDGKSPTARGTLPPQAIFPMTSAPAAPKSQSAKTPSATPKPIGHPVINIGLTKVVQDLNTGAMAITVNFINASSFEANVHLHLWATWIGQKQSSTEDTRDVAIAQTPGGFAINMNIGLPKEALLTYMNQSDTEEAPLQIQGTASYPDKEKGGITTFVFSGTVRPKADTIDIRTSRWDYAGN